jgi:hypothetical protein
MYPGQEYWHRLNPNIRRAEENWMYEHGFFKSSAVVHETDIDKAFEFLEMPPIPREALEFIDWCNKEAEGLTHGKDAGTNSQR